MGLSGRLLARAKRCSESTAGPLPRRWHAAPTGRAGAKAAPRPRTLPVSPADARGRGRASGRRVRRPDKRPARGVARRSGRARSEVGATVRPLRSLSGPDPDDVSRDVATSDLRRFSRLPEADTLRARAGAW